jgi:L-alanine-DL-glutamate epimerase-like enolase superfamily enzyme
MLEEPQRSCVAKPSWDVKIFASDLPLAHRFTISSASWDSTRNVFVVVRYGDRSGVGEASPDSRSGESAESIIAQLEGVNLDRLEGPFDLEGVAGVLGPGAARCALDIALHDLAGKTAGLSIAELLGCAGRDPPPTSVTVPISSSDEMTARARDLADFPILKVKVGFEGDVDAVRAVREVYGGVIRIDANEGWNVDEAKSRLAVMEELDIEMCEQPVPAGDLAGLAEVASATTIPVLADEAACTAADVARLSGVMTGVNLKLRKAGGIRETVKAIAVARAHEMKVMLGCDLTSGIAATAEAHVASLVDHADVDGPLLLADDPWPGVAYEKATMIRPPGPGLGLRRSPS